MKQAIWETFENNIRVITTPEDNWEMKVWIAVEWRMIVITEVKWFEWWIIDIINWVAKKPEKINEKWKEIIDYVIKKVWDITIASESKSYMFDKSWNTLTSTIDIR